MTNFLWGFLAGAVISILVFSIKGAFGEEGDSERDSDIIDI